MSVIALPLNLPPVFQCPVALHRLGFAEVYDLFMDQQAITEILLVSNKTIRNLKQGLRGSV
jgi:hypothetical protein